MFALVFLNHEANFPVTVGMLKLNTDRYMAVFNLPAAGLVISQIPIVDSLHPDLSLNCRAGISSALSRDNIGTLGCSARLRKAKGGSWPK